MKFAAFSCGALLCALAPSVLAAPADGTAPPAPGPVVREVDDITNDPFVKAYFDSLESAADTQSADGKDFKIVNGTPVTTPLPWFASINMITIVGSNGQAQIGLCGGSLINSKYVLTAAHCFAQETGGYFKPATLQIGPGRNDVIPNVLSMFACIPHSCDIAFWLLSEHFFQRLNRIIASFSFFKAW